MREKANNPCWKCKGTKIIPSVIDSQEDATCTICMGDWCNKCYPPHDFCECDVTDRHDGKICRDVVERQCDECAVNFWEILKLFLDVQPPTRCVTMNHERTNDR